MSLLGRSNKGNQKSQQSEQSLDALDLTHFGPLEPLLRDERRTEYRVLGHNQIWFAAPLTRASVRFDDHEHLMQVIQQIMSHYGKTLDADNPSIHFKTLDGFQITAMIPPVSSTDVALMIRKYVIGRPLSLKDMAQFGTLHQEAVQFLTACVQENLNILITGEALTGKTTLLQH